MASSVACEKHIGKTKEALSLAQFAAPCADDDVAAVSAPTGYRYCSDCPISG